MPRRMRFFSFLLVIVSTLAVSSVYAQEVPDAHEIILKLSASPMADVPKTTLITMKIPAPWESQVMSGESVSFRVPFHPGVTGKVEHLSDPSSPEADIHVLEERFHTDFQIESQDAIETGVFIGTQVILSGRLGGERWKIRLYSGTVAKKYHIRFYAQSPDFWFHIYMDFFDEILQSIQPKA